jgi:hypothetical protein
MPDNVVQGDNIGVSEFSQDSNLSNGGTVNLVGSIEPFDG